MIRKAAAFLMTVVMMFCLSISVCAQDSSFRLAPDSPAVGNGIVEYMSEQKIYHFVSAGDLVAEIPVSGGIYAYVTLGGYKSGADGTRDNGINCVCRVNVEFLDGNNEAVDDIKADTLLVPADGTFRRYSLGKDNMYAGMTESVKKVRVTVSAENDTAYIRELYLTSSDTVARDMSQLSWEVHELGNIDAQTGTVQRIVMIGFICAVAAVMMIFAKVRNRYRKGK